MKLDRHESASGVFMRMKKRAVYTALGIAVIVFGVWLFSFLNRKLDRDAVDMRICIFESATCRLGWCKINFSDCKSVEMASFPQDAAAGSRFLLTVRPGFFGREWIEDFKPYTPPPEPTPFPETVRTELQMLLEQVPSATGTKNAFELKLPTELTKKIEANRSNIFSDPHVVTSSQETVALGFAEDDGTRYFILQFSNAGKLSAAIKSFAKWGQCKPWTVSDGIVKTSCEGAEGGEVWSYDTIFDFKNRKVTTQDTSRKTEN